MNKVISVSNLSKVYRLGQREKESDTLLGQISKFIKSPLTNLNRIRFLNRFENNIDSLYWALKDVSFDVNEGEVLGIIGKNGAGKSTLLKILSQITQPTSGKIEIHGRVASLLEVGTGFHPELSGRENIYMNGTILGMTRREIDSKLDEIIDFSGVEKFIDTPVKFYSSGMKVRLGFSVAAHLDPEILIIDEVLAVGDYEFQKKCLGKMQDVSKKQGRTVLFVSHNLGAVQNLCSSSILLESGKLRNFGSTSEVIKLYLGSQSVSVFNRLSKPKDYNFWIKSITVLNKNLEVADSLFHNLPFVISVELEVTNLIKETYLLISILDSNARKIFSSETLIKSSKNFKLLVKECFLTRGDYSIQAIVYKPGISQYDFIENECRFTIVDVGSSFSHLETFDYGVVFGNYEWL